MSDTDFSIVERFFTLSGEAPTAGQPVYLVRFSDCNLHCTYCDTPNRNEINETLSTEQLQKELQLAEKQYPGVFILLTGGEPLLGNRQQAISQLAARMENTLFYVETNGAILIRDFGKGNLRYVADWKLPSSGEGESFCQDNLKKLRAGLDCMKLVVAKEDLHLIPQIIQKIHEVNSGVDIYLSPQTGKISLEELSGFILEKRLNARLSVQLHKIIWGINAVGV